MKRKDCSVKKGVRPAGTVQVSKDFRGTISRLVAYSNSTRHLATTPNGNAKRKVNVRRPASFSQWKYHVGPSFTYCQSVSVNCLQVLDIAGGSEP